MVRRGNGGSPLQGLQGGLRNGLRIMVHVVYTSKYQVPLQYTEYSYLLSTSILLHAGSRSRSTGKGDWRSATRTVRT